MVKRMKMKKYIQSMMAFAAIVSFASCSSEDNNITLENESATKIMTFTATQEGDEQSTRAAISTSDSKVIKWEEGDQISIFDGKTNNQFNLKNGAGTKSATFQGVAASAETYTAVYPYQSEATLSGTSVEKVTLKATQNATANSFDKEAALMIAEDGDGNTLNFKNVVGYVKVKPTFNCTRIDLKAFDNSAVLAGTGTVSYNNGKPTLDLSETKDYAITLRGDIKAGNYYYIAVPPVTLKAGWTIKFTTKDGTKVYSRKGTKPITFTRNKVTDLGEFATDGDYWAGPRGIVDSDQEVDMGVFTIGDKNYRVIFAKSNLTKEGLATNEYDYGDYFAWGATEPWYYSATQSWKKGKEAGFTEANAPILSKTYRANDVLSLSDDAARQILGGDWQLPTKEIWKALWDANKNKVYWGSDGKMKFDTISGIKGMKISKKDDPNTYIFLPAAGSAGIKVSDVGDWGYYWSGTANSSTKPYSLYIANGGGDAQYVKPLYYVGRPVRPVRLVKVSLAGSGQGETEGIEEDVFNY